MISANDKGPPRFVATESVDVRELADYFSIDEDRMRTFCLEHEEEIGKAIRKSALDIVDELGHLEGLFPLTEPEPSIDIE
jgi:hypothetical protein